MGETHRFVVSVEVEHDAGISPRLLPKVDEWITKLVRDRMGGLKRASRGFVKGRRYKAWVAEVEVERADG